MVVKMIEWPKEADWMAVKQRALVTIGKNAVNLPDMVWKESILSARHSPIRRLRFSFYIECPYYVSVHLARHVHAQPYIQSQRNDRQEKYDRNKAPQDAPVKMIWDMEGEELLTIANKRLCHKADPTTREVVRRMCILVEEKCPEFARELVPNCIYHGGCKEMQTCGLYEKVHYNEFVNVEPH